MIMHLPERGPTPSEPEPAATPTQLREPLPQAGRCVPARDAATIWQRLTAVAQLDPAVLVDRALLVALHHAPLQRVEDLTTWLGVNRATVYRHLDHLAARGWIGWLTPPAVGRGHTRFAYLTPAGTRAARCLVAAAPAGQTERETAPARTSTGTTSAVTTLQPSLARLLPRLPALSAARDLEAELIQAADAALGPRCDETSIPALAWHWCCAYHQTFRWRARMRTLTVETLVTLHVLPPRASRPRSVPGTTPGEMDILQPAPRATANWTHNQGAQDQPDRHGILREAGEYYALWLVLDPGAGGLRLLLPRLAALFAYRSAPARWEGTPEALPFPPLLVVASSWRRATLWRQAMRLLCRRLHTDPLAGVLWIRPPTARASWPVAARRSSAQPARLEQATWLDLATGARSGAESHSGLRPLFTTPLPFAALPPGALEHPPAPLIPLLLAARSSTPAAWDRAAATLGLPDETPEIPDWLDALGASPEIGGDVEAIGEAGRPGAGRDRRSAALEAAAWLRNRANSDRRGVELAQVPEHLRPAAAGPGAAGHGAVGHAARTSQRLRRMHLTLLDLLAAHPLICLMDLAILLDMAPATLERRLRLLHHLDLIETRYVPPAIVSVAPPPPQGSPDRATTRTANAANAAHVAEVTPAAVARGYRLTEPGWRYLAAVYDVPVHALAPQAPHPAPGSATGSATAPPGNTRAGGTRQPTAHTSGVYRFFALLAATAAAATAHHDPQDLLWWETGSVCAQPFTLGERTYLVAPDGIGEYAWYGGRRIRFWLEWDTGSMNQRDLEMKFAAYAAWVESGRWRTADLPALPLVLVLTPDYPQEVVIRRALHTLLERGAFPPHAALPIRSTTLTRMLGARSLAAPIWLPLVPEVRPPPPPFPEASWRERQGSAPARAGEGPVSLGPAASTSARPSPSASAETGEMDLRPDLITFTEQVPPVPRP